MTTTPRELQLSEPFAFALLQWPALIGALAIDGDGWMMRVARFALWAWVVIMGIVAYRRPRGFAFGNAMVLLLAIVAGACWSWPGPWTLAWLPVLLVGLRSAQQVRTGEKREATPAREASESRS